MSKLRNNPLFQGISGRLGDVVFRQVRGQVIIAKRPTKRGVPSPRQQKITSMFARAAHYAKAQMLNPVAKAKCESRTTRRKYSAYLVAVSDYLKNPSIRLIDTSRYRGFTGDMIAINPADDSSIVSVHVAITTRAGTLIEQGKAEARDHLDTIGSFHYRATVANYALSRSKITATIKYDGNKSTVAKKVL